MQPSPHDLLAVGEVGLFLIGVIASLILLGALLLPALLGVRVPAWAHAPALTPEGALDLLRARLAPRGYEVLAREPRALTLRADAVTYTLRAEERDGGALLTLRADGLDLTGGARQSLLGAAGAGWLTLKVEEALRPAALAWGCGAPPAPPAPLKGARRPLGALARAAVTASPWR